MPTERGLAGWCPWRRAEAAAWLLLIIFVPLLGVPVCHIARPANAEYA